jgi:hypothetical protein
MRNSLLASVLSVIIIAVLSLLLYISFEIYAYSKTLSEIITLIESLVIIVIGLALISKRLKEAVSPKNLALSITFGVLLYAAQWAIAYVPAFVWYTPPFNYFATALFVYLPEGIIVSVLLVLTESAYGSLFMMIIPFYIISMISFFNPVWTPFYFSMASLAEIVIFAGKREYMTVALASIVFSATDAFLASQFMLFNFGVYQPPVIQLSSVFIDIIFSIFGAFLGLAIGKKAKTAWRP